MISSAQTSFDEFIEHDFLNGAFVGILVKDIEADEIVYALNDNLRFTTASILKLFTSAAAVELLGPDYKFETSFYINGDIDKKGKLAGDLIIVGGGDPLISGRFRDSVTEVLEFWADSLLQRGIKTIEGDIVVDNSFFESDELGPGWSYDYLTYWYACPISPLSFNDNCVDFRVYPAADIGGKCRLEFDPRTDYIKVINNTITLLAGLDNTFDFLRHPETNIVEFFGGIAIDDENGELDYVSVHKPHLYCVNIFKDIIIKKGIKFKGQLIEIGIKNIENKWTYNYLDKLFTWQSEPMSAIIKVINKNSQNFFAEQTLKTIGAELAGVGSFDMSTRIVTDWIESIGITAGDVHYYDGSGLTHMNLATPASIIHLLRYMYNSQNFDVYYESLAIPGIDRSVRSRMKNYPMAEQMRTKTGSIANTRTFAGYLTTKTGKLLAFSIMVNNYGVTRDDIDNWTDKLCGYIIDNY